jgi:hypothetical protein
MVKFLIRAALGVGLAVILSRLFWPRGSYYGMAVLAVFIVGMAYVSEYIRKRG